MKSLRSRINYINRTIGKTVIFKPGYPTKRGVYMILSDYKRQVAKIGISIELCFDYLIGVGHDYNYNGDLHTVYDLSKIFK